MADNVEYQDTRKGFLTPEEQKQTDDLKEWGNKFVEIADGFVIKYGDDWGLERLKQPLVNKFGPGVLPAIYEIIDGLFEMLPKKVKK